MPKKLKRTAGADPQLIELPPSPTEAIATQMLGLLPEDDPLSQIGQLAQNGTLKAYADMLMGYLGSFVKTNSPEDDTQEKIKAKVGDFASQWAAQSDANVVSRLMDPAKKRWMAQRDKLLMGMHPDWTEADRKKNMVENPSLHAERIIANLLMYKNTNALKIGEQWMRQRGVTLGGRQIRTRQAYTDVVSELYGLATSMDNDSPWKSMGGASENMKAMLFALDSGALEQLRTSAGMFDREGNITDMGKAALRDMMTSAGNGMQALKDFTGARTATNAIKAAAGSNVLGSQVFSQLTNPEVSKALSTFNTMAKASGLSAEGRMGLLHKMRSFLGSDDLRPALQYGTQLLGMSAVADNPINGISGDPAKRQQLAVIAIDRARRDPKMKLASAAAAALEPEYGREVAWSIADDVLAKATTSKQMVAEFNQWLPEDGKLTRNSVNNLLAAPGAYDYFASGRPVNASIDNVIKPVASYMKRKSKFMDKYASQILQERGRLDTATIADWMKEKGASPQMIGAAMNHLRQFGPMMTKSIGFPSELTTDDVLGFVSAAAMRGNRKQLIGAAENQADFAQQFGGVHSVQGVEAMQKGLAEGKGLWGSIPEAIRGTEFTGVPGIDKGSPVKPGLTSDMTPKVAPAAKPAPAMPKIPEHLALKPAAKPAVGTADKAANASNPIK